MAIMGWSPDIKKKKDKLSWIVKFLQMDLDSLTEGEKKRLMLSPMFMPSFAGHMMKVLRSGKKGKHLLPRKGLKLLQDNMKEFFNSLLGQKENGFPVPLPSMERELTISGAGSYKIEYPTYVSTQIIVDSSIFISGFADLLNGLPNDCMKKCPGCEKYFVHISRKKKLYCSNRCAYKTIYLKRKEKLFKNGEYGTYLNKQSKKMKKRYREKILNGKGD